MRSEKEMLHLIREVANNDQRIRAAYLEGSRANANAPKDLFQDYDVGYIVEETKSFREDKEWIKQFGAPLYMQYPEENVYYPSDIEKSYGWLIQFTDGNRLDLHVCTTEHALSNLELYITLLDKDNLMPKDKRVSDEIYWIKKPTSEQFHCTCNEFWWCLNNVAKGLWREEILYTMDMINDPVRPMLRRLLEWKIGIDNQFSVNIGKSAKYMSQYLSEEIYSRYLQTYPTADISGIWEAVDGMCGLFDRLAVEISEKLNFPYNLTEARNSRDYLNHIRKLPADANKIFE